mmetsp:Transcript_28066/g.89211  ORF Transcript_28066/g.89211 Transcript_28066/m.89211 type:complete len:242 (+) Transcript_28066:391-1116(+)
MLLKLLHRVHAGVGEVPGVQAQGDEVLGQICQGPLHLVLVLDPAPRVGVQGAVDAVALHHLGHLLDGVHQLGPAVVREPGGVLRAPGRGLLLRAGVGHDHEELGAELLQGLAGRVHLLEDHLHLVRFEQLLEDVAGHQLQLQVLEHAAQALRVVVADRAELRAGVARLRHQLDHFVPGWVVGAVRVVHSPGAGMPAEAELEVRALALLPLGDGLRNLHRHRGKRASTGGGAGAGSSRAKLA